MAFNGALRVESWNFYDLVSSLIPGLAFTAIGTMVFPEIQNVLQKFPDDGATVLLIAMAYVIGELLRTIGSKLEEPLLHPLFGGATAKSYVESPETAADKQAIERIREYGTRTKLLNAGKDWESEFALAKSLTRDNATVSRFNALYGATRTYTVASAALFLALLFRGGAVLVIERQAIPDGLCLWGLVLLSCTVLFGTRAKQRDKYFVREVFLQAATSERVTPESDTASN